MAEFTMPSLGADMDAGTIVEWRVRPGDAVHRGDIVAVVDTEKSDIEVEVFDDGVIEELLVQPGEEVAVGTPLARIAEGHASAPAHPVVDEGAAVPTPAPAPVPQQVPVGAAVSAPPAPPPPTTPRPVPWTLEAPPVRTPSSPLARRLAAERGVELGGVNGSGPGGAVRAADLPKPTEPGTQAPVERARPPDRAGARRAVGELMARSAREVPHYYLGRTVDLSVAMRWLADQNAGRPATRRLLPAALLLKATALAAPTVPGINGTWDEGYHPCDDVHLGVAVSLRGGGLLAPAIRHADQLPIEALMGALRDLVERARAGRLRASEMSEPTITVTNLGDQGADEVYGVIYRPQVALVGFGRIAERPWAEGGMVGARPTVRLSLAADHRATDGHDGSRFLAAIDHLLHTPEDL
jgi:pyruvate dehydrogenase E2 component (dihydrolipoamide acetyltransferase)